MTKALLFEEFHVTFFVHSRLDKKKYESIRRTLNGRRFRRGLEDAVRQLIAQFPPLRKTSFRISL